MKKRIFSMLLAMVMVVGMLPTTAIAATGDNLCDHHTEHTADCGYVEGESECTYVCGESHGEEPAEEPASLCTCESDDPAYHAPFCALYAAPEAPACLCVELCAEGSVNEWCEVCYFDHAACAASGEEEAAEYAGDIIQVPSFDPNLIKSLFTPIFGSGFTLICESRSMELCVGQVDTLPVTFDWGPDYAYHKNGNDYVWPGGYLGDEEARLMADEYPWQFLGVVAGEKRVVMEVRDGETLNVYRFPEIIITVYDHSYANGFCTRCGSYEPAELVDGYYQIGNGGQMFWFANHINTTDNTASAKLTADINLESRAWTPMGTEGSATTDGFRGTFDGNGKTISGLNVTAADNGVGFIGEIRDGTVKNFTISGKVNLIGKYDYVGGVIGSACGTANDKGATISGITSYVNVILGEGSHGSNRVAGLVGYVNHNTNVENCAWYGTLDLGPYRAQDGVGGLVGKANTNYSGTIRNCGAYGTIKTSYQSMSFNSFDTIYIGGIVSNSLANAQTKIENCIWAGTIVNNTNLGTKAHISAVGTLNGFASVTGCYVLNNAPYVTTNSAHDSYITAVTDEQMASGEVAYKLGAAWGQTIGTNDYPILGGAKVYYGYDFCSDNAGKVYSNAQISDVKPNHNWTKKDGKCTVCGKECEHSYKNGTCTVCGYACTAHSFVDSMCTVCGYACTAHSFVDSKCTICGYACTAHSFVDSKCTICGYACTAHSYDNGTCTVCGTVCAHIFENCICTICDYECTEHSWGEWEILPMHAMTGGKPSPFNHKRSCTICGLEEKAEHTFDYKDLGWGDVHRKLCTECPYYDEQNYGCSGGTATCTEQAICQYCGALYGKLSAHTYDDGICTVCGTACTHESYTNGFCTACGGYESAALVGDCYEISNAGQLYWFAKQVNSGNEAINGKLTANIAVNENVLKEDGTLSDDSGDFRAWTPIGKDANNKYTGTFDGNGKTVSGLYFDGNTNFVGLFGWSQGTVKNVGVVDSYFCSSFTNGNVGGVVGYNNIGTVENCYNAGAVKSSGTLGRAGGVVGSDSIGTIKNCYNTGAVSGEGSNNYVGGVVGYIGQSTVENCYNTGAVRKPIVLGRVGGVVGYVSGSGTIKNCYNRGAVISTSSGVVAGGVLGNTEAQTVTVENCYYDSTVYNGDAIGGTFGGTATNVEGKTTEQFKSGEVAYLLGEAFGQKIDGEGEKDTYPAFSDAKVYEVKNCKGEAVGYSNTEGKQLDHIYDNGICTDCDEYEPAKLVGDCYEIGNMGQLYWFAEQVNSGSTTINGKLIADITVNTDVLNDDGSLNNKAFEAWTPIASYGGTFDGNGKTVSGLYYSGSNVNNVGFIGSLTSEGTVKNLTIADSYICGSWYVGGVVGYNNGGTVDNCSNSGTVIGVSDIGGVVGYNINEGELTACYNTGKVNGISKSYSVGGVVGNNYGTVENCSNSGSVEGGHQVGGVVGYNVSKVTNCYNTGNISVGVFVGGGISGYNCGTVTNCYNIGDGSGDINLGAVVGLDDDGGTHTNCYYLSESATDDGGKTAAQFASGEVAYLLQGEQTEQVWGQNIDGEGEKDAYPVFSDAKVYPAKNCDGSDGVYSNTQDVQKDHIYSDNGFCTFCKGYQPATGDGTESDPYKIGNAGQLYWFAAVVNEGYGGVAQNAAACAELTANITVNADVLKEDGTLNGDGSGFLPWTPIGNGDRSNSNYTGTFNGNGKTVSGLYFDNSTASCAGLFGWSRGTVKNVGVVDSYLSGSYYVGGVVGQNDGAVLSSYNSGAVSGSDYYVGGVVGFNSGTVEDCYNTGAVSGYRYVGGVVGSNDGTVEDCYNTGAVSGSGYVGGVVGYNSGTVANCYSTGAVSGSRYVGGVAGINNSGTVLNSYNTGSVSGSYQYVGGVVGHNSGTVEDCYNTGTVSGSDNYVGGVVGENYGTVVNSHNIGSVSGSNYVGGVVGYNYYGTVVNCYYDSDIYIGTAISSDEGTSTDVWGKTTADFASGEVAYLLSQGCTVGEGEDAVTYSGDVWGQNLDGEGEKDAYPVFSDAKVYEAKNCKGEAGGYSNTEGKQLDHTYDNGFCTVCGSFEPAVLVGDYYEISNAGQLYWFAKQVNDGQTTINGKLTANIAINEDVLNDDGTLKDGTFRDWSPIGTISYSYSGTFDGDNHTVSGLYVNGNTDYVGLFGHSGGTVQNVGVVDSYISGNGNVGGMVGYNSGTVENCYNAGFVCGTGDNMIGGVVGNNEGTVEGCYNTGSVSGTGSGIGGVAGYNYGSVTGCYNAGPVSGNGDATNDNSGEKIGGVIGLNNGPVAGSYNTGTVSGIGEVGGVVGGNYSGTYYYHHGVVTNCYNTGAVSGSGNSIGGVAGSSASDITGCYNTGPVSGNGNVGGLVGSSSFMGTVINSYYDSDVFSGETIGEDLGTAIDALGKTTAQFASGEVAYLLGEGWGQNVDGEGEKDACPIFSAVKVYPVSCCPGKYGAYSNTEGKQQAPKYNENGFCIYCGGYESATGSGTESDPYQISNAGQLYWFAAVVNTGYGDVAVNDSAWAELTANITVNEAVLKSDGSLNEGSFLDWTPIADGEVHYFGTFDGNGFAVSGLYFHDTNAQYAGLFGILEGDAVVQNVGVVDSYIHGGNQSVGAVAGTNMGTVEGSYNAGTVIVGESNVGGVVGENNGPMTNCYNAGPVSGSVENIGGVTGYNGGPMTNCYNAGPVSGSVENIGGVTGFNVGSITNCYYDSTVYSGEAFGNSYGTATNVEGKTTEQFKSGEVAYLLGETFGQTIGTEAYPVLGGKKVNYGYDSCAEDAEMVYTNKADASAEKPSHSIVDGKCENCDYTEEPAKFEIVQQPVSVTGTIGETVSVTVVATGEGLTYQWYLRNGGGSWSRSSTTTATYEVVMNKSRANRELYCIITDANGNTLKTDVVSMTGQPTQELKILTQPTNAEAKLGENYCVEVIAQGDGLTYTWYWRNKSSDRWNLSGVKDNTYDDVMTKERTGREVYCIITDAWGNCVTTETATLVGIPTVDLAIVTQPNDASAKLDEVFCVTVEAQGEGLTYTWYWRNKGQEKWSASGVKDNTYDDVMTRARHNREVYCVITDAFGNTVTSDIALITGEATVQLEITKQPENQVVALGEMFNFTVEARGEDIRYQWFFRKAGTETWTSSSQRDNTYDDVMIHTRHNRELYCLITDAWGNQVETSPVVLLEALPEYELAITAQPEDESVKLGEMFCVTVEAQGDGLKYQWYWRQVGSENWNLSGQRDNTYDDLMTKARNNREVKCVITDMWGDSVETEIAVITAIPNATLAIVTQPTDAFAAMGGNYCVTVEAVGDELTYTWYFKNAGTNVWHTSTVRDNTYDDVMIKSRAGRLVYCVITDAYGNKVTTETVTLICTDIPQAVVKD